MSRPLLNYLADFTLVSPPADLGRSVGAGSVVEAPRLDDLLAAARAEGAAAAQAEAEAQEAELRQMFRQEHEAAMEAARAGWAAGEGTALGDSLRTGLAALETVLADSLAEALTPLIEPALRSRAAAELRAAVTDLMAGGQGPLIEIRGPDDLLEVLRGAWDERAVTLQVGEGPEVLVTAGETTIRSQLSAWTARFQTLLQAPHE